MPDRCVVHGCGNQNDEASRSKGISLHGLPYWGDDRPMAKRRRKRWVDFVHRKRAKFVPSQYSTICSEHFKAEDFERRFSSITLPGFSQKMQAALKRDEFGIVAFPSVYQTSTENVTAGPSGSGRKTNRARRQVSTEHNFQNLWETVLRKYYRFYVFEFSQKFMNTYMLLFQTIREALSSSLSTSTTSTRKCSDEVDSVMAEDLFVDVGGGQGETISQSTVTESETCTVSTNITKISS